MVDASKVGVPEYGLCDSCWDKEMLRRVVSIRVMRQFKYSGGGGE